ncbi:MAG: hypothetical protein NTV70_01440 [Acidobacteria bacterium]|nr:hypothetical protein [Acidobacteriota bacterium]
MANREKAIAILEEMIKISEAAKADRTQKSIPVPNSPDRKTTGRYMEQTFTELLGMAAVYSKDLNYSVLDPSGTEIAKRRDEYFQGNAAGAFDQVLALFEMNNNKVYKDAAPTRDWVSALNTGKMEQPVTRKLMATVFATDFLMDRPDSQDYTGGTCPITLHYMMELARALDEDAPVPPPPAP